jgi:hypothetical protein
VGQISYLSYVVGLHPHASKKKILKLHDCPIVLLELENSSLEPVSILDSVLCS